MAEGRFLSKSIATSRKLKSVSLEADYLFKSIIPHMDREGRIDGDPDIVKAIAVPLRAEMTHEVIARCLAELDQVEVINWYEVDGQKVVWIPNFHEHQQGMRPERERPSKLPAHDDPGAASARPTPTALRENSRPTPDNSGNVADLVRTREVKLREVKGPPGGGVRKGKSDKASTPPEAVPRITGLDVLPKADCDALFETWASRRGVIAYSRFRKTLLLLFQSELTRYTTAEISDAIIAYADWVEEQPDKEQGFCTLDRFITEIAKWVRFGKMPLVQGGEMTERGQWAGSRELREEALAKRTA